MSAQPRPMREGAILFLVAAVQFVNILDFMMVMPLGPDFAAALGIPADQLGLIGGSYTAAAALSGLAGSFFLDRFDRRKALGWAMLGLVLATASGALATGLGTLLVARVAAGFFGGPAASISLAIVADVIPPERRGRAMGLVMVAFSVASVLGVPAGLELAAVGGWQLPFLAVAALGAVVVVAALSLMPPMRRHLDAPKPTGGPGPLELFTRPVLLLALFSTALMTLGVFIVIPNISTFVQHNLGYPREHLGRLYFAGGIASFVAMPFIGRLVDRVGATAVLVGGTLVFAGCLYFGFIQTPIAVPVIAVFVFFMLAGALRNVPFQSLSSRVPELAERARFMSIQSAVQHLASAAGAFLSVQLLQTQPDQTLAGMPFVAGTAIVVSALVPVPLWLVERSVTRREQARGTTVPVPPVVLAEAA